MANILKKGPRQYLTRIRRKGPDGKRVLRTKTFETRGEAEEWAAQIEGRIASRDFVDRSNLQQDSLSAVLDRYVEGLRGLKSERDARLTAAMWKREPFAGYAIGAVTSRDLAQWVKRRRDAGKAASTINNALHFLSKFFKVARREMGYEGLENPVDHVTKAKQGEPRSAHLTPEQEQALLDACQGSKAEYLIWVVRIQLATAMRQGEVARLRWEHVHETHVHLPVTKNGSARDVPLTMAAHELFQELAREWPRRQASPPIPRRLAPDRSWSRALAVAAQAAGLTREARDMLRQASAAELALMAGRVSPRDSLG
ncbi:MAG: tyrosine-type recombinase/integrase [Parvibaculaceae bacterium]|nr:tyrosine-type recombinase/integrase [Parvibaculaceae bacterium]